MDRHPPPEPRRPYDDEHGDVLRFDALVTGTLRGLWERLTKWTVPAGYLGSGHGPAFAPSTPVALAVRESDAQAALKPWLAMEDQLAQDVERYGCAFTLTTRSGTRRVEPWRVSISMLRDTPARSQHIHADFVAPGSVPAPLDFDEPQFDYHGGKQ